MRHSRDVYANLLRDTRGMRREHARARDGWYAGLAYERKEEALFALEMLLKGFACFGNPRNHPGRASRGPAVAHDFREEGRIVRDALAHSIERIRELLGEHDRAYVFSRYLETVLPEDTLRSQLVREQLSQDTPEEALFVLRNTFGSFLEMAEGTMRVGRISHRLYFALLGTITREVGRNAYFNPLVTLEFRAEFDRIRSPEVLEALHATPDAAHRVVSLAFLSLFRLLRYVQLVDEYAADPKTAPRAYMILAVLRSDVRALCRFMAHRAGDVMADAFERELMHTPMAELNAGAQRIGDAGAQLVSLRAAFDSIASTLKIEVRKTFERDLQAPSAAPTDDELGPQLVVAAAQLRASFHHAIRTICGELVPAAEAPELASKERVSKETSARLRRDVWMFQQVLRAFLAKATSAPDLDDRWGTYASFQFVREFVAHFKAIGYQLARRSDYAHLDRFLDALRDAPTHDVSQLRRECREFYAYLGELFAQIGQRAELHDVPFDKREAAEHLRLYLGAA